MALTETQIAFVGAALTVLVAGIVVHFAARIVIDRSTLFQAILTVLGGTILASVVHAFIDGTPGLAAALAAWALVAALVYRTRWVKGALIGVVAWILWALVLAVLEAIAGS